MIAAVPAPHFRTVHAIADRFDALAKNSVRNAVSFAVGSGLSVNREDVELEHIDELAAITDPAARIAFTKQHAAHLSVERSALSLIEAQSYRHARQAEEAVQRRAVARETFVSKRADELEAEWQAARRAEWRVQAASEFDSQHAPPEPEPAKLPRPGARRTA